MTEFTGFPKIARLNREIIVTEKIDGTNALVEIAEDGSIRTGSRNRYITPEMDNHGFAGWVRDNTDELHRLGPGRHFGEWWGSGIQSGYGLAKGEKRFSLFNVSRWGDGVLNEDDGLPARPACCGVVPTLYKGPFSEDEIKETLRQLEYHGSVAAPGFMRPEGVIVFHTASGTLFKVTIKGDEKPKGLVGGDA